MPMSPAYLILLTVVSIVAILLLIVKFRMQAFIALLLVSLVAAVAGGIPLSEVAETIREGMGSTLGYIAVVIGIGTMVGEILQVSGGASQIANTLVRAFGEQKAPWALSLIGLIIAIPVFFEVALILFIPLVYDLTQRTGRSLLPYGIPLAAGIAVAHAFIPPTPGPVAVASLIGADLGWVILIGLSAGLPAAIVGGVYYGKFISQRLHINVPLTMIPDVPEAEAGGQRRKPGFGISLLIIIIPLLLILLNTVSKVWLPEDHDIVNWLSFIGHPFTALLISSLLAFYFLGTRLGFTRDEIQQIATKSMEPVGMIILLTGAGGVFGRVLIETGVGDVLVDILSSSNLPIVLFAFLISAVLRVSQGSATVAMVTTGGLLAPVIGMGDYSPPLVAAVTIAIASGATILSHVNDSGFWLVKEFMGMTEKQTLQSWTVMETIIGFVGLAVVLVLSWFL